MPATFTISYLTGKEYQTMQNKKKVKINESYKWNTSKMMRKQCKEETKQDEREIHETNTGNNIV